MRAYKCKNLRLTLRMLVGIHLISISVNRYHWKVLFEGTTWWFFYIILMLMWFQNLLEHKIFILNSANFLVSLIASDIQIMRCPMLCLSRWSSRSILCIIQDLGWESSLNKFPTLRRSIFLSWVFCSCGPTAMSLLMRRSGGHLITTLSTMTDRLLLIHRLADRRRWHLISVRLYTRISRSIYYKVIYLFGNGSSVKVA